MEKRKGLKNRPAKTRRANVITRLESQLQARTKNERKTHANVPLTEGDVKRINKELITLKSRI